MGNSGSKHNIDIKPAFEKALDHDSIIISVGSGFGVTERELESEYKVKIITIDPLEEKFQPPEDMMLAKLPMFPDCHTFMEKYQDEKSDIIMILDWPSPYDATYAIEAIELVKPKTIVIRYASCGAAGSKRLQSFLKTCDCPNSTQFFKEKYKSEMDDKYEKIYQDVCKVDDPTDFLCGGISYTTLVLNLKI